MKKGRGKEKPELLFNSLPPPCIDDTACTHVRSRPHNPPHPHPRQAQLSESIGVEGIKRIVAVPSSSSSSAGAVAAAAPSTTERPRSASIGAGAAEDESGNSGRQRSGTDAAAAAAAAVSPRRSSAAGGAGGDGGGGLDGGGGTKSILKIGSDSPRSGKGVSFARLSPGPGERPVIPSVAVLQPAKQLEFTGLAREPLQVMYCTVMGWGGVGHAL